MRALTSLRFALARLWWFARQVTGDAAYENYLSALGRRDRCEQAAGEPLSSREFYVDSLRRRYKNISRCC